ncbi:hypothetical protein BD779DRAFT_824016 [Infundibulicybe gibba]|nr:hypothetical protein BD779DRAFT_824016 [Infundibulicybe gibba]
MSIWTLWNGQTLKDSLPPPISANGYNISLNLSSILAFLPSRILARVRRLDTPIEIMDPTPGLASLMSFNHPPTPLPGSSVAQPPSAPPITNPAFPGPLGFFTSRYMLGLIIMAIIMHRIQNTTIPTRLPHRFEGARPDQSRSYGYTLIFRRARSLFFPLNLSHIPTRVGLHLPSLYLLLKILLLWGTLVLQSFGLYPALGFSWVTRLGEWSSSMEMSQVCWMTFCAICMAFSVEGFVRALDGLGGHGFMGGQINSNTSFNLVGYAFLLHIYSSPNSHIPQSEPNGPPTRPDKHVIITIAIPLLQLTILHALSATKPYSSHRLIPTALTSILSLAHFHGTLFSHYLSPSSKTNQRTGFNYNYPWLNYIPNLFETMLIATILLTVCLNVIVQMLVKGRIERLFAGLGLGVPGAEGAGFLANLPYEEEFGVLLLRAGTASLESTGLRGWGNEVAPVSAPVKYLPASTGTIYGSMKLDKGGISDFVPASIVKRAGGRGKERAKSLGGFQNEIRTVDLGVDTDARSGWGGWLRWARELRQFLRAWWSAVKGLMGCFWGLICGRKPNSPPSFESPSVHEARQEGSGERHGSAYERFLRGEAISDDEGDEFRESGSESESESLESDVEHEDAIDDGVGEAVGLYSDFMGSAGENQDEDGGEVVLAHMIHRESGPLTRRRYAGLVSPRRGDGAAGVKGEIYTPPLKSQEDLESMRRLCVICICEAREVICWPCRCLAMCDGCRETLATRGAPAKHRCPCCRRNVEGYSRIYIP